MRKIPTIFERDWDGDRSRVLNVPAPGCEWVFAGEGVPTRKFDGTCVAIIDGSPFKRFERKVDKKSGQLRAAPEGFIPIEEDHETGNVVGWTPITREEPADQWFWEAEGRYEEALEEGTYELVGPKIQKNHEGFDWHSLVLHGEADVIGDAPIMFEDFETFFETHDIEGIVWHHPDGRMAKIKGRDFGIKRLKR